MSLDKLNLKPFLISQVGSAVARRTHDDGPSVVVASYAQQINVCGRDEIKNLMAACRFALSKPKEPKP